MNSKLRKKLIRIVEKYCVKDDPAHDFLHIGRVLKLAEKLAKAEGADMDIVIPAALFHDLVIYPKGSKKNSHAPEDSAKKAGSILEKTEGYPKEKIDAVMNCIKYVSFSKGLIPESIEGKVVQDADMLEATGAISIMRTFSTTGKMNRTFYEVVDPFAKKRKPNDLKYALDLFYTRLLVVEKRMNTKSAKKEAKRRTKFLRDFLNELKYEI